MGQIMSGGRPSFLKKRSKKLLDSCARVATGADRRCKSFLVLFFKKELLPSLGREPGSYQKSSLRRAGRQCAGTRDGQATAVVSAGLRPRRFFTTGAGSGATLAGIARALRTFLAGAALADAFLAFDAAGVRAGFWVLRTSRIIDIAALATDARDVSGTASSAVRKA
jgi:hypothetical protein